MSQRFLSAYGPIAQHFQTTGGICSQRQAYRAEMRQRFASWAKLLVRSGPPKGWGGPGRGPRLPEERLSLNNLTKPVQVLRLGERGRSGILSSKLYLEFVDHEPWYGTRFWCSSSAPSVSERSRPWKTLHSSRRCTWNWRPYATASPTWKPPWRCSSATPRHCAGPDYAEKIVETIRDPLLVLTADLRVQVANPAFYHTFQVHPAETEGQLIYQLGNGQWDIPALRTFLEELLPHNTVFNDYEVTHTFEQVGPRTMLLNARRLDDVQLILLAIEDITVRTQTERRLQQEIAERQRLEREPSGSPILPSSAASRAASRMNSAIRSG